MKGVRHVLNFVPAGATARYFSQAPLSASDMSSRTMLSWPLTAGLEDCRGMLSSSLMGASGAAARTCAVSLSSFCASGLLTLRVCMSWLQPKNLCVRTLVSASRPRPRAGAGSSMVMSFFSCSQPQANCSMGPASLKSSTYTTKRSFLALWKYTLGQFVSSL